ncbi:MAG: bifunctional phosphoglucose/phosphomannose isomerase [Actinomycetota bacterium]|nr:bifunctional phosphoglucose/phosphomannose isomerase [Actinomycetota bacterium]|tara:strand:+ start:805 stop:1803 length:999 start_codon:yes stop_codon:yes gene_type:complete
MEEYIKTRLEEGKNPLRSQITEELEYSKGIESIKYESLLVMGMGGSGIAGDVLKLVSNTVSTRNVIVRKDYSIPSHISEQNPFCLFISYSGNTEETISGLNDAIKNNLDWAVISSGGQLIDEAKTHGREYIKIPSGLQPRNAFGYLTQAVCRFVDNNEGTNITSRIQEETNEDIDEELFSSAHNLAKEMKRKTCLIYGGTPMTRLVASRWKTQINENAKSRAFVGDIPEVHHNEILSWDSDPEFSMENYHLVMLRDEPNEHEQIIKRFNYTEKLLEKKVSYSSIKSSSKDIFGALMYLILLGDLISIYLAEELGIDTMNIDTIEELKKLLKG